MLRKTEVLVRCYTKVTRTMNEKALDGRCGSTPASCSLRPSRQVNLVLDGFRSRQFQDIHQETAEHIRPTEATIRNCHEHTAEVTWPQQGYTISHVTNVKQWPITEPWWDLEEPVTTQSVRSVRNEDSYSKGLPVRPKKQRNITHLAKSEAMEDNRSIKIKIK